MKTPEVSAPETGIHPPVYEFGDFRVDASKRLLRRRDGSALPLTPKVFDTLLYLVKHSHTVLDKEQLMEAIWPDSIVEENNLSQNISTLRRVFGENPGSNRFIATVPGRGYRFVADVKQRHEHDRSHELAGEAEVVLNGAASADENTATSDQSAAGVEEVIPRPASRLQRTPFLVGLVIAAMCAAGFALWRSQIARVPMADPTSRKSIAVLPFENLMPEPENAFFADGIQDDVLTSLGKIKDLKVIARASVTPYRGLAAAGKLREIGKTLGVSHVLQGSVRRDASRIVVNVALIDMRDDRQVWSERYERTLTDTLSLQGELAVEVARTLRATLTPAERTTAATKPTDNAEAYVLYLRARTLESSLLRPEDYAAAVKLYEEAIALDPTFALARARLSLRLSQDTQGKDPARNVKARAEAQEALRLRPDLAEARLALASCLFWVDQQHDRALAELSRAAELSPSSAEVPLVAAFIHKTQNRWRERIASLQRAETLDPLNPHVLRHLARTLRWVRDWPEAIRAHDRLRVLLPEDRALQLHSWRANDEFRMAGDINVLKKAHALDADAPTVDRERLNAWQFETAMFERDYAAAAEFLGNVSPSFYDALPHPKWMLEAMLAMSRGDDAESVSSRLEAGRVQLVTQLTPIVDELGVAAADLRANVALCDAFLGRKEDALRRARASVELETGPLEKNDAQAVLALVCARSGETDEAIDLIERTLTVPTGSHRGAIHNMTLTELKWRWVWDPLRSHPRFQKLVAGPEPKTVY